MKLAREARQSTFIRREGGCSTEVSKGSQTTHLHQKRGCPLKLAREARQPTFIRKEVGCCSTEVSKGSQTTHLHQKGGCCSNTKQVRKRKPDNPPPSHGDFVGLPSSDLARETRRRSFIREGVFAPPSCMLAREAR